MIRLFCRGNVIEYTGDGWIQCSRQISCPKKKNNKVLGFDCLLYIDNLPENFKLMSPMDSSKEQEHIREHANEQIFLPKGQEANKRPLVDIIEVPSKEEISKKGDKGNGKDDQNIKDNVNISTLMQKLKLVESAHA